MDDQKKAQWMIDNHHVVGAELAAVVTRTVENSHNQTASQAFVGSGNYHDAADLAKLPELKDKPGHLSLVHQLNHPPNNL